MPEPTDQNERYADAADRVAAAVVEARCRGERVSDREVMAAHAGLGEPLRRRLATAAAIASACQLAGGPGPAVPPLRVLSDEELEAPIEVDGKVPAVDGYEVLEELGRGGQGVVYRGRCATGGPDVAIKVLPGGRFAAARARSRFAREARILARLRVPGVVSAVAYGATPDGSLYLVMPYVAGPPLDVHVAAMTGGDPAVARLFADLAGTVAAVHAAGVVHRDLKPSNVRVGPDGRPNVLDFGMADSTVAGDLTRTLTAPGQVLGSTPWLSPEQARGDTGDVDARSDVYALGLMLCCAISAGHAPPYRTDGPPDRVLRRVMRARPRVAGRRGADPLARVALRCLAKRPAGRYPTAAALADDLRRVATGDRPRSPDPCRRRPLWIGAATTLIAAAVGAALRAQSSAGPPRTEAVTARTVRVDRIGLKFVRLPPTPRQAEAWVLVADVTRGQVAAVLDASPSGPGVIPDRQVLHDPAIVDRRTAEAFCAALAHVDGCPCSLPRSSDLARLGVVPGGWTIDVPAADARPRTFRPATAR